MTFSARPLIERLFDNVSYEGDCWIYAGYTTPGGYATINMGPPEFHVRYRHIVAYELLVGPIPAGFELDHLCRRPACFNPDCLEPVTRLVNNRRSNSWAGRNYRKTCCPQGHLYDETNTYVYRGRRHCRACRKAAAIAYYHRQHKESA